MIKEIQIPTFKAYHNYRTGETDYLSASPDDWRDYVPQHQAVLGMYEMLVELGTSPAEAAVKVLTAVIGDD